MKIATWNVNSLRVRLPQILDWIKKNQPTVLALQETKVEDDKFPENAFTDIGYHVTFSGQKTYNGVAILSPLPPQDVLKKLPNYEDPQKRFLAATYPVSTTNHIRVINLYIPNGESVGSEKYHYKLDWLNQLEIFLREEVERYPQLVVLGDFNIAPQPEDVYDPIKWAGRVLFSDPERAHFARLLSIGFVDAFRAMPQEANEFSWWDYRTFAFRRNHGLRIDHILVSSALKTAISRCYIDKKPRAFEQPSDHTPVSVELTRKVVGL
jgi:exodeoxyribonuclease III